MCIMSELPIDVETILHEAKQFLDSHADFPALHNTIKLNGLGQRTRYEYIVDVNRKYCSLNRITYHQRVFTNVTLLRLDIDTKPHRNPDGQKISGTHLHVYREGYGDSWAYELNDPALHNLWPEFDFSTLIQGDLVNKFYAFANLYNFTNEILFGTPLDI